jgi:hypothetical protein
MSTNESEIGIGAEAFAKGTWYHELLEDGLALSYRVRARRRRRMILIVSFFRCVRANKQTR